MVDRWQIPSDWRQAGNLMGLAELVLAACHKMEGLMIVGLEIGTGFGEAVTDGSGAVGLCSLSGIFEKKSPGCH